MLHLFTSFFIKKVSFLYTSNTNIIQFIFMYLYKNFDNIIVNIAIILYNNLKYIIQANLVFLALLINILPEYIIILMSWELITLFSLFLLSIWVNNSYIKKNYPNLYIIVKLILFILLIVSLFSWLILIKNVISLVFGILKFNIITKLQVFKAFLENKFFNNPKNPRDLPIIDNSSDKKRKEKLEKLKEQLFQKQSYNYENNITTRNGTYTAGNGISRGFQHSLTLKKEIITKVEALTDIKDKIDFYTNQKKRFENTIYDIKNSNHQWYDNNSISLFKEYLKLIDFLTKELKIMEKQVKNSK
jgi:hypothetical protein